jgi:Ca-activated chloride channel family protein
MIEALQQFHFLRPWWLLALVGLPLALWPMWRASGGVRQLSRLVDADLLPHLLHGRAADRRTPLALVVTGWLLATLAFAGPAWSRVEQPLYANRAAQVLAMSMSQRMLSRDVAPSRLDRAEYKARDLLASNRDGQNALIAYAGQAFVVAPLTSDANSLDELLEALSPDTMPTDGDNAADAIARGVSLIQQAKAGSGSLVLITDHANAAAETAARQALAAGVRVSVLGVGTPQGGPIPLADGGFLHNDDGSMQLAARDDRELAALAAAGGGRYVPMSTDHADIDALHAALRTDGPTAASDQQSAQWQDRGPWLLLPLLLVVALGFRRGWLLLLPLVLLPLLPATARADQPIGTSWTSLWQRSDQQAAQALRAGNAAKAQQLARDPALRAAAAYRAGDFATSAQTLQSIPTGEAQYNLGNALARQGQFKQAIAAYDGALKLDPANADAQANRKAVEDWLRKQQQEHPSSDASNSAKDHQGKDHQGKDGQQGQDDKSGRPGSQGNDQAGKDGQQKPGQSGNDQGQAGQTKPGGDPNKNTPAGGKPPTAQEQAAEQARAEQARQALQQQMDQRLGAAGQPKPGEKNQPHQLGMPDQDDPSSKLPAQVRQALQRVPDDPGALLRRKFEREYRQRQGAAPGEDDSP